MFLKSTPKYEDYKQENSAKKVGYVRAGNTMKLVNSDAASRRYYVKKVFLKT